MKTVVLYLLTPLVTFTLGVGFNGLTGLFPFRAEAKPACVQPVAVTIPPPTQVVHVPVPAPPPSPIFLLDYPKRRVGTAVAYLILGPKPKEFADFEEIQLTLSGDGRAEGSYISISEFSNNLWKNYEANFALVTERRVFFATSKATNSEFEYRFDGEFVRTDFNNLDGKKIVALRGKLTKTKDGRKIAERELNFRMEHVGC